MTNKQVTTGCLILCISIFSPILLAHEFWLQPQRFRIAVNEAVALNFYVGENFMGEIWGKRRERTRKLTHFEGKKQEDWTARAIESDSSDILLKFDKAGTHVLTMESRNSFIALDAEKFNEYLREDGIEDMYQQRQAQGELDKPSRELYRRCAKTLIQVGTTTDQTYRRNTGMTLELIALQSPYTAQPNDSITVKVLFKSQPLKNKMVVTWNKNTDVPTRQKWYTDAKGQIKFPLDQRGQWMVSTVQMIPLTKNPKANYQSYWGNLTFEF